MQVRISVGCLQIAIAALSISLCFGRKRSAVVQCVSSASRNSKENCKLISWGKRKCICGYIFIRVRVEQGKKEKKALDSMQTSKERSVIFGLVYVCL